MSAVLTDDRATPAEMEKLDLEQSEVHEIILYHPYALATILS